MVTRMMKFARRLGFVTLVVAFASVLTFVSLPPEVQAQVYNYFPPPGIGYTQSGGMTLGSATGGAQGAGTLNAQGLYVGGVAVSTSTTSCANPSATIGLSAINGVATTCMRSDAAPALSQGIVPTWTGAHTFTDGATFNAVNLTPGVAPLTVVPNITSNIAVGGVLVNMPTAASAGGIVEAWQYNSSNVGTWSIVGAGAGLQLVATGTTGGLEIGAPTGSLKGASTINVQNGIYSNGTLILNASTGNLNSINLFNSGTNASSATLWRGDGSWANSLIAASGNNALGLSGAAGQFTLSVNGNSTSGQSEGVAINAGTTSADLAVQIGNQGNTVVFEKIFGDGGITVGNAPTGGDEGVGTINVSGNYYQNGVALLLTGTFTGTLTGMTATINATFTYKIVGNLATVICTSGCSGTSNSTSFTMTGLPSNLQPASVDSFVTCNLQDNSSNLISGLCEITHATGTVTFARSVVSGTVVTFSNSGFTSSGSKGLNGTSFTYTLQ